VPGAIFPTALRPVAGQGLAWSETLGGQLVPQPLTQAASGLTGLTLNRVPFGNSGGGLQDSTALTWNGTTFAITGAATISTTLGVTGVVSFTGTTDASALGTANVVNSGGVSIAKSAIIGGDAVFSSGTNSGKVRNLNADAGVTLCGGTGSSSTNGGLIQVFGNSHATVAGWGTFDTGATNNAQLLIRNFASSGGTIVLKVNGGATAALSIDNTGNITIGSGLTLTLGTTYSGGAPAATGYIPIKDSTGTVYKILVST
jgi:hypothetical protein